MARRFAIPRDQPATLHQMRYDITQDVNMEVRRSLDSERVAPDFIRANLTFMMCFSMTKRGCMFIGCASRMRVGSRHRSGPHKGHGQDDDADNQSNHETLPSANDTQLMTCWQTRKVS
ncbi:MAG: hypothetical protein CMF74_01130 [Maricaulis sp.]|nr:hypothetical protein [Maricaulis sp.]